MVSPEVPRSSSGKNSSLIRRNEIAYAEPATGFVELVLRGLKLQFLFMCAFVVKSEGHPMLAWITTT